MTNLLINESLVSLDPYSHDPQTEDRYTKSQRIQDFGSVGLSLQTEGLILTKLKVKHSEKFVFLEGICVYANGQPLMVPVCYQEAFIQVANRKGELVFFRTKEHRNQVHLSVMANNVVGVPHDSIMAQCAQYLLTRSCCLQQALQSVGLAKRSNRIGLRLTRLQLETQKEFADIMAQNQTKKTITQQKQIIGEASAVLRVKKIQANRPYNQVEEMKTGGYFKVSKTRSTVFKFSGEEQTMQLAQKTPRYQNTPPETVSLKINRQIKLVQKIISQKYALTYYMTQEPSGPVYMQYVPGDLKQLIHSNKLSFEQLLNYSQQIVEAVSILHRSGVIHRDLKPDNILVRSNSIKIIDFAESAAMDQPFNEKNVLGCTFPYSPIECLLGKEQGFNKKQIDLWSVSMILYEMVFRSLPLFYSRWIGLEFLDKWRNSSELSLFPLYRKRSGLARVESIISAATLNGLEVNPQKRISLSTYARLLSQVKLFYNGVVSL